MNETSKKKKLKMIPACTWIQYLMNAFSSDECTLSSEAVSSA